MSIFSILNRTVTFVPTVETRIESIAKTTVYGPVHDKEVAIEKVRRLYKLRHSKKRTIVPEPNPCNWFLDPSFQ